MTTEEETCPVCHGTLHVLLNGAWKRCDCFYQNSQDLFYDSEVFSKIDKKIPKGNIDLIKRLEKAIRSNHEGKIVLVTGENALSRWQLLLHIFFLKSICQATIYGVDFNTLIKDHFEDMRINSKRLYFSKILWLRFDFYRKHDWAKSVLTELITRRSDLVTVISSPVDVCGILGGSSVPVETFEVKGITWIVDR